MGEKIDHCGGMLHAVRCAYPGLLLLTFMDTPQDADLEPPAILRNAGGSAGQMMALSCSPLPHRCLVTRAIWTSCPAACASRLLQSVHVPI